MICFLIGLAVVALAFGYLGLTGTLLERWTDGYWRWKNFGENAGGSLILHVAAGLVGVVCFVVGKAICKYFGW